MNKLIQIFKPGEFVIATPKNTYKDGLGLCKTLVDLEFSRIEVPQGTYISLIHCEYGPMLVLESKVIKNNKQWAFKVLGANKAIGWITMRNPNFCDSRDLERRYYLERFVP